MGADPFLIPVVSKAVAGGGGETTLCTHRTLYRTRLTMEVKNTDGSQTVDVIIYRRASLTGQMSPSNYGGLMAIPPGESRCADLDVAGSVDTELRAVASGLGLTVEFGGVLL